MLALGNLVRALLLSPLLQLRFTKGTGFIARRRVLPAFGVDRTAGCSVQLHPTPILTEVDDVAAFVVSQPLSVSFLTTMFVVEDLHKQSLPENTAERQPRLRAKLRAQKIP